MGFGKADSEDRIWNWLDDAGISYGATLKELLLTPSNRNLEKNAAFGFFEQNKPLIQCQNGPATFTIIYPYHKREFTPEGISFKVKFSDDWRVNFDKTNEILERWFNTGEKYLPPTMYLGAQWTIGKIHITLASTNPDFIDDGDTNWKADARVRIKIGRKRRPLTQTEKHLLKTFVPIDILSKYGLNTFGENFFDKTTEEFLKVCGHWGDKKIGFCPNKKTLIVIASDDLTFLPISELASLYYSSYSNAEGRGSRDSLALLSKNSSITLASTIAVGGLEKAAVQFSDLLDLPLFRNLSVYAVSEEKNYYFRGAIYEDNPVPS